jgi:hypothetical protein
MSNELTVIQMLANVGQSVMSMATSVKTLRDVRKQDAVILEEKLRYLRDACRARGIGELTRLSIDEMERTLHNIQQKNFTGNMLEMAMKMLQLQYETLCQIIQNYFPR